MNTEKKPYRASEIRNYGKLADAIRGGNMTPHPADLRTRRTGEYQ